MGPVNNFWFQIISNISVCYDYEVAEHGWRKGLHTVRTFQTILMEMLVNFQFLNLVSSSSGWYWVGIGWYGNKIWVLLIGESQPQAALQPSALIRAGLLLSSSLRPSVFLCCLLSCISLMSSWLQPSVFPNGHLGRILTEYHCIGCFGSVLHGQWRSDVGNNRLWSNHQNSPTVHTRRPCRMRIDRNYL